MTPARIRKRGGAAGPRGGQRRGRADDHCASPGSALMRSWSSLRRRNPVYPPTASMTGESKGARGRAKPRKATDKRPACLHVTGPKRGVHRSDRTLHAPCPHGNYIMQATPSDVGPKPFLVRPPLPLGELASLRFHLHDACGIVCGPTSAALHIPFADQEVTITNAARPQTRGKLNLYPLFRRRTNFTHHPTVSRRLPSRWWTPRLLRR